MQLIDEQGSAEPLLGFADVDWANDAYDRKSNYGYLFKYVTTGKDYMNVFIKKFKLEPYILTWV